MINTLSRTANPFFFFLAEDHFSAQHLFSIRIPSSSSQQHHFKNRVLLVPFDMLCLIFSWLRATLKQQMCVTLATLALFSCQSRTDPLPVVLLIVLYTGHRLALYPPNQKETASQNSCNLKKKKKNNNKG